MIVTGVVSSGATALAQDSTAPGASPAASSASVPQLAYGVSQILQLAQAKVGDDTIIAYIRNSGNSYGLNADQIIYLRQQGISDAVITAMLSQPRAGVIAATPATSAPSSAAPTAYAGQASTVPPDPAVTYVQTVPAATYYYSQPYYYYDQPCYYPGYVWYPPVSFSFGWYGGWHGSGYRGGWYGGGYHGGGFGGGGFHGGGGRGGGHR